MARYLCTWSQPGSNPGAAYLDELRRRRSGHAHIQLAQAEEWRIGVLQPNNARQGEPLHAGVAEAMRLPGALAHLLAAKRGPVAQADLFVGEAGHLD